MKKDFQFWFKKIFIFSLYCTTRVSNKELSKVLINFSEAFTLGQQKDDVRITVTEGQVVAPDYTEGEVTWQESRLVIKQANRSDDGLYECQAVNVGGKFLKSGHISVEFPPTFEEQVISEEWSWDQRATNLSCLGEF